LEYARTQSLTNPSYLGYNECIGNDNFSPLDNGFMTLISTYPIFSLGGEYWNAQQPCNYWNHLKYAAKQKRFGNPADYVDLDPVQAAYQVYLQTGQCPVASSFQLLLNQTAQQQVLENASIDMNTLSTTSALIMAIQDFEVSGPLPALTWQQLTNSPGTLSVRLKEGTLTYAEFNLFKNTTLTPTFDWDEIVSFTNLQFTQISGGLYEFTVSAQVSQGGVIFNRQLTGNTNLQIGHCSFPETCKLNDQGKAAEKMLKLLAAGSQLTSTSYVTVSSAPYDVFCTQQFQYAVNPAPSGVVHFRYVPSLPGFEFVDAGFTLTLGINSVEPSTFNLSSLSLVASISEMIPGPNNTFKLVCKDLSGNELVTLNCDAIRSSGSGNTGIQMGTCGLAESILCQGAEYQTFDDLHALFKDVLVSQNDPFDLVSSPNWTNNLIGLLPSSPTALPGTISVSGGRKKLTFTLPGSCSLVLSSKDPTVNFNNITAVGDMHAVVPPGPGGATYDFYLLVTYTNGSTIVNDTLFGTSCFKINECTGCSNATQPSSYTAEQLQTIASGLKIAGILEEDHSIISYVDYKNAVNDVNTRLGWTPADAEYIRTISYSEYFDKGYARSIVGYIHFATNFVEKLDDHYLLENPSNYIEKYGSGDNLLASYDRYVQAVQKYNQQRSATGKTTIPTVALSLFAKTIYSEDCSEYVKYLDQQTDQIPSALAVTNYPNTQAAMIDESQCMDLYTNYYNAYQAFVSDQQNDETCLDYEITMPLVPYQTFIDNNLCCSSYGIQVLTDYIASFSVKNTCPGPIPMMQDCTSPTVVDMDLCRDNWSIYVSNIEKYNTSAWAQNNHSTLVLLYPSFKTFAQMGYCECVADYNAYLQTYIDADGNDQLPPPQTIDQFCDPLELDYGNTPCQDQYEAYLHCVAEYNEKAIDKGKEYVVTLVTMEAFYENDLCYCVDEYCSQLNMVLDGLNRFEVTPDLYTFCNGTKEEPCVRAGANVYETFEMEFDDPCTEFYESNIAVNAQINYNEQVQNFLTTLAQKYIAHCMSAFENMTVEYTEIEHHFTLYYYDQAGNLIRTVPPEGVELLDMTDTALKAKIKQDRENNTHQVMTNHRMATTYLYNSLNQLVAQNMPDQDAMKIFEAVAPDGLPIGLNTTAIQMVDANTGYLTGYIANTALPLQNRGFLFKTTNGGSNWTRVSNLLSANLKEVVMTTATRGYAIADEGILLMTNDAGFNWDLMDTYSVPITEDFVALDKDPTNAYALTKSGKIWELTGASITSTSFNLSSISGVTVNEVKDFTLQGVSPASGTTLYLASVTSGGNTYDAVLMRSGTTTSVESSQVADLKTIGFFSANEGFAAGADGNLSLLTGNGAAAFFQKLGKSGTSGTIDQVHFFNNQVGIARISENGTKVIRKTTDGGLTWESLLGDYTDASLAVIRETPSYKEILIQGFANGTSYSRAAVLTSNGMIELNQTPNIPQTTEMKAVSAFVNGSNVTYFAIGANNKLYRSNTFTSSGDNVTFTEVTGAGTLPAAVKKLVTLKSASGEVSVEVLLTNGTLHRSFASTLTGSYSAFAPVSGPASIVSVDKLTLVTTDYLVAYAGNVLYGKSGASGSSALVSFATTITTGTSVIEELVVHGALVSLAGTNGGLFTTNAAIAAFPSSNGQYSVTFVDRKNHGYTDLTSIRTNGNQVIITGKNGLVASRTKSTATQTSFVRPVNTTEDIYESAYRVNGSDEYVNLAGSNGYFSQQKIVSGSWVAQAPSYTTFGIPLATYANGKTLRSIAVNGQSVYLVGDQGSVYYTADINTALFIPATPVTAARLNSVVFIPGQPSKVLMVGEQTGISRYNATAGTRITAIHPGKLKDVHFENGQKGTVAGDYYFVRTTVTGASSWQTVAPASLIAAAVTSTGIQKVMTKPATNGNHHYLLGTGNALILMKGNNLVASASLASAVTDLQFNPSLPLKGYLSAGTALSSVELVSDVTGSSFTLTVASLATAPNTIYALHVFENHSVVMAGANGMIYYRKSGGTALTLATVSGVTFNDIYFRDNTSGVAVGNAGAFYYLNSNGNNSVTHEITASVAYSAELTVDPELNNNTGYNIRAIAYSSLNKAVYGGEYSNSADVTSKKAFVRSLKQENNLYTARFFYDRLGRIVVSQNSRQLGERKFSYTLYDPLGRVYEAGEKAENTSATIKFASIFGTYVSGSFVPSVVDDTKLATWLNTEATTTRKEVTRSYYDVTNPLIAGELPLTLDGTTQRKRIVHVTYEAVYDGIDNVYDHATHYDYDIHGNLKTLLQDNRLLKNVNNINQHRFKRLDYIYDLISGNVHRVDYQTGKADQWHHAYNYDADNRITDVYTSTETPLTVTASSMASLENEAVTNPLWDKEADYTYYAHGPLARTVLGEEEVQGLDYVYTLQGWIKGVNSNTLDPNRDPGEDGKGLGNNRNVARDAYGYSLHYFEGDYSAIGGNNSFIATQPTAGGMKQNSSDLYNGNIARMVTTLTNPNTRAVLPLGNAYRYDQLNRLKEARSFNNINLSGNTWNTGGTAMYYNAFDYDANGNIIHQVRKDDANVTIDDMAYYYENMSGATDSKYVNASMKVKRNRLRYVNDGTNYDANDIDPGMASTNYGYDAEGRLAVDVQEKITRITWRVDGKIRKIERPAGATQKNLIFDYDALGHRIAKHVYSSNNVWEKSTYYILDAQGNTMAVYDHINDNTTHVITFTQTEKHIYGSSRLGTNTKAVPLFGSQNATYAMRSVVHYTGKRSYELNNHLGNVLSVISDKVIPHQNGSSVDYWLADIRQSSDYSPFGVLLKNRDLPLTSGSGNVPYRYGFQGQEKDDEIKGAGNSYTTEFRQYDSRLGRWLSLDKLCRDFPWQSPYVAYDNNPINIVDPLGSSGDDPKIIYNGNAKSKLHPEEAEKVILDIMSTCGLKTVTVGSLQRSPEDQARVMMADIKGGAPDNYANAGTAVQKVYYKLKKQGKTDGEILNAMTKEVYKQGPANVSQHCADPSQIIVFDISLSSVPRDKVDAFVAAVEDAQKKGLVRKNGFQYPGNNRNENAYHIEVPLTNRPKVTIIDPTEYEIEEVTINAKRTSEGLIPRPIQFKQPADTLPKN
jgi:RHS repeat-associated protein